MMKKLIYTMLVCVMAVSFVGCVTIEQKAKTLDERMEWFDEAKFGLFIHWGAYSSLKGVWKGKPIDGYAEWVQAGADIPKEEYEKVAATFAPDKFDADQWIRTAKQAGMKYMVITTKHHDGFCMWDSEFTEYDIRDSAGVTVDLLGELQKACKKHGIVFGTYYSIIDWHHPTQKPNPDGEGSWGKWGKNVMVDDESKAEYVQYMKNQLKELIDRYDTQIFWFDGDWNSFWTMEDGMDLYAYLRELQPDAIINNRVAKRKKFKKDFGTPEQFTPGEKLDHYWEACWTINHSWGYKEHDKKWKSTEKLIRELVDITSKGGNFLLNVGPTDKGEFPKACEDRLKAMGDWLAVNGDAIYETEYAEVPLQDWGRVVRKGNVYYLHVFDWPESGKLVFKGVSGKAKRAYLWGSEKTQIEVKATDDSMVLFIPTVAPGKHVSVLELMTEDGLSKVQ